MDGAQPLISRSTAAMPMTLQMFQELTDDSRRQILHGHPVDGAPAARASKRQQQGQRVSVTDLGVLREIALGYHVVEQEAPHPRPQQVIVSHDYLPAERSGRSVGWPPEATLVSCASSIDWTGCRRGRDRSQVGAKGA